MSRWLLTLLLLASASLPVTASAAFQGCEDARQYGANTAQLYVGQAFARIDCDASQLDKAQHALGKAMGSLALRTSDSDDEKVCYYEGLWFGLLARLSYEYESCGYEPFTCIERGSLATYAGSLLRAIANNGLANPGALHEGNVGDVFQTAGVDVDGAPICASDLSASECTRIVQDKAGPQAGRLYSDLMSDVGALACSF